MRSVTPWLLAFALVLAGCTSAKEDPTTTATSQPPVTTTSTVPDLCPDVFCVVFRIDPAAEWSDGTPVSAADFRHTLDLARADPGSDPVYALVTGLEESEGGITISFSEVTGGFTRLFQTVLPAHDPAVISGDANLDEGVLTTSGAVVQFVPVDGVRGAITALQRGDADMIWIVDPPSWAVDDLSAADGVTSAVGPGPDWEMVTFNQANPLLAEEWVRRSLVMALDREAMLDATVRTVYPGASSLDSTLVGLETAPFPIAHDPEGARSLLGANGCAPGADGVLICGGLRMSLDWVTTTGDPWRLAIAEMAEQALEAIGVEITVTTMVPSEMFAADHLFGDAWDIAAFAWEAQSDPVSAAELYRCRGDGPHGFGVLNVGRHCGDDALLASAEASFDSDERMRLMSEVDRAFVSSAAIVPLFSRPVLAAWADGLEGVQPGPFAGPLDRLGEWSGTTRLAMTAPLGDPAQVGAVDPVTAAVRRLLYRGAFLGLTGGEYLPDLVIEFETVGG